MDRSWKGHRNMDRSLKGHRNIGRSWNGHSRGIVVGHGTIAHEDIQVLERVYLECEQFVESLANLK